MEEMERHHMLMALSTEITRLSGMKAITSNIDEHKRIDELINKACDEAKRIRMAADNNEESITAIQSDQA